MLINILCLTFMIAIAIVFFVVGHQLNKGKWFMLIAGYNFLPKEERDKIDSKGLGKQVSFVMNVTGTSVLLFTLFMGLILFDFITNKLVIMCVISFFIIFIFIFSIYEVNKMNKEYYDK